MIRRFLFFCVLFGFVSAPAPAVPQEDGIRYQAVSIHAVPPDPDTRFDVDVMAGPDAMAKLKAALDLIREKSPAQAAAIEDLKTRGPIYLVYNPNYPSREQDLANVRVALFMPFYFAKAKKEKPLPVLISRHGIKWPLPELAAVLVHELVGHGGQYLQGITDKVRTSELECQAWLQQEMAYQVFGLNKDSREMIRFRQQLSGVGGQTGVCTPFFKYIASRHPDQRPLFEQLNPDVPALLPLLDQFISELETAGVTAKALAAQKAHLEAQLKQMETRGTPRQIYATGLYLLEGAGYYQDLTRGVKFIRLAAEKNDPAAQVHLAILYTQGRGVKTDTEQAFFWLAVAARTANDRDRPKILRRQKALAPSLTPDRLADLQAKAAARPL